MHQIQLNDQLYQEAQRRATEVGFGSVDEYVAEVLQHDLEETENLDHFFTPERLAHIDRAAAQIAAGQGLTSEQVDAELAKRKDEMASPKLTLTVILSPTVVDELHGIWQWNAEHYSSPHADAYVSYLKKNIYDLARRYAQGKTVSVRPDLRCIIVRRKAKGHGHVPVYRFDDKEVNVLHVFHTAQNWQAKLADEPLSR